VRRAHRHRGAGLRPLVNGRRCARVRQRCGR
jgi:hypothetical protein